MEVSRSMIPNTQGSNYWFYTDEQGGPYEEGNLSTKEELESIVNSWQGSSASVWWSYFNHYIMNCTECDEEVSQSRQREGVDMCSECEFNFHL